MENKRLYPATQCIVALPPTALKVYMWILSWSATQGCVKYFAKQFKKACKMDEEVIEQCIQTLVNCKLVDVSKSDGMFILTPNAETNQKYYKLPIAKVLESDGISMATDVTWNKEVQTKKASIGDIDDMSDADMKRMLLMLQARLNEKEQVKAKVANYQYPTDLPF